MSEHSQTDLPRTTVLIVGGGLSGLMLGALLENAKIPYHILERSAEARPLAISGNILPAFEQLGIYEELKKDSLRHVAMDFYDAKYNYLGIIETKAHKITCGYDYLLLSRPKLYDILRRQIPDSKFSLGKKVLRTKEDEGKSLVYCSDNSIYECAILVGADGAYSAVRQNMYTRLTEVDKLPPCDKDSFTIGHITMVGVATPPNPEKYPQLSEDRTHFRVLIGNNNETSYVVTVPGNQFCWALGTQVPVTNAKDQQFRNSEWGPESLDAMMEEFKDLPCPFGGTMNDLFNATPKNLISKVFLEEKVFKTWYHGRSVLLGDACHKMLPGAGQDLSNEGITAVFENYYKQRYPEAELQFTNSAIMSKIMFGQKRMERFWRNVMLNHMPYWILQKKFDSDLAYRPQINWLPLVENRGTGKVLPQEGREEAAAVKEEKRLL
ncbi:hypothetical protein BGX27_001219 [Mortierella sp. AM989]|nr:hypothetical protein BGX27_001219 [Mortierella sp. AM989]